MNQYAAFAEATAERAIKTAAQSLAALLIADGTGVLDTAWGTDLSVAGMAALLSVLTSIASAPFGGTGPSLANEVTVEAPVAPKDDGVGVVELLVIVLVVLLIIYLASLLF